jgi:hypothetical protein
MTDKPDLIDVKAVWQSQSTEDTTMSLDEIRGKIGQLEKKLRKRDLKAVIGALIVMAGFTRNLFIHTTLIEEIGSVLTLIGAAYIAYQLFLIRKKRVSPRVSETGPSASANFYRGELERQRDFHRGLWFWSRVVIFLPGPLVFLLGRAVAHPELIHQIRMTATLFLLVVAVAVPLNLRLARKYQHDIDDLDGIK